MATGVMAQILADEDCCEYEEELQHNPYSLKLWMRYLDAQKSASTAVRTMLYERALLLLPRSYKLWRMYLSERRAQVAESVAALDEPRSAPRAE